MSHRTTEILMTPRATVPWAVAGVESGLIYSPRPEGDPALGWLLKSCASGEDPEGLSRLCETPDTTLWSDGELVLKRFGHSVSLRKCGVLALQANVMLQQGLEELGTESIRGDRTYRAPRVLGAFLSLHPDHHTVWAMEHVDGLGAPLNIPMLEGHYAERTAVFDAAIDAVGGNPAAVDYDDKPENTIVRVGGLGFEVVKFDVAVYTNIPEELGFAA